MVNLCKNNEILSICGCENVCQTECKYFEKHSYADKCRWVIEEMGNHCSNMDAQKDKGDGEIRQEEVEEIKFGWMQ